MPGHHPQGYSMQADGGCSPSGVRTAMWIQYIVLWQSSWIFLQSLFDSGRSHSTLKVFVAAIPSQHTQIDGVTVGSHRLISLFLKGVLRLRPPRARRAPAWDLPLLSEAVCRPPFEPLAHADLKWLSMKAAFLLAVVSAKRVGELHALSVSETCLRWNPDGSGVILWPNVAFLPKVLTTTYVNQPIKLARFD